jgi:hypothetical protein
MEQRTLTSMKSSEGEAENHHRLPRLLRLDDVVLTHMLLSPKPILAVSKSILEPVPSGAHAASVGEGEECFFFYANWQAVC